MIYGREKRRLLGWLALVAPLPLPLNEPRPDGVVGWLFLLAYVTLVGIFLRRAYAGEERWLGPLALNLLGLAYIPVLILDLTVWWQGYLVRPMMHLVLFALVVKLFALRHERDKWQVSVGIFFVFVASMATSASPVIVLYLVLFLALGVHLLARFAELHVASLARPSRAGREAAQAPVLQDDGYGPIAAALVIATIVAAAPLFVLLPRLGEPYILGRGGDRSPGLTTGFSDEVSLDVIGRVRTSRQVALRIEFSGPPPNELRLRGAAFDEYLGDGWERSPREWRLPQDSPSRYRLAQGSAVNTAELYLERLNARSLIVPVEALTIEFDGRVPPLSRNRGGGVRLPLAPAGTLSYRVGMAARPVDVGSRPRPGLDHTLDTQGISSEIAELAATVAGTGVEHVRAARIERHLMTSYEYTLDFIGRERGNAIDDFLFRYRSGHCEYFASAMVLMLRTQGIPARFVTGFLGGEDNPLGYYIVRQSNAHAWVEAYLPELGWTVFDPTPAAGRPSVGPRSIWSTLRQTYDFLLFGWDRYVISYGVGDQAELLAQLRAWIGRLLERGADSPTAVAESGPEISAITGSDAQGSGLGRLRLGWVAALALLSVLALALWRRRPPRSATRVYLGLRQLARRSGLKIDDSTPPQLVGRRFERRCPAAAAPASRIVSLYLRESYGEQSLTAAELQQAEEGLQMARRSLRRAS